jgi:hypothetical protein
MALTFSGVFQMKNFLYTTLAGLVLATNAMAFSSAPSGDPVLGFRDVETATVIKVDSVTGYDDAVSKGHALFFEDGVGGLSGLYQVSRNYSGTYNTALASKLSACIATKDVATGDVAGFPCAVKGYVDYALYSVAGIYDPISVGSYLCISDQATALGRLVGCASGVTSPFIALEAKTTGSGSIKVRIVSP